MISSNYLSFLPSGSQDHYDPNPLGMGTRMVVFKGRAGHGVLRAPLRSEAQLVASSGEYRDGISNLTHKEIERYNLMEDVLGNSLAPVTPFYAADSTGELRTYSTQRHIAFTRDLRSIFPWEEFERDTTDSLRELIDKIRELIKTTGLIPDLAGRNNVVMNGGKKVKLIDINNIQPLLSRAEWSTHEEQVLRTNWHEVIGQNGVKRFIHPEYLDDKGYPIADVSLLIMRNWERVLGRSNAELDSDDLYGLIADGTMRDRLLNFFLHSDL